MISFDTDEIKYSKKNYQSIHAWLGKTFGKANKCENEQCKKTNKNYYWAKLKDKEYDFKRENFIMLCGSCHYWYDKKQNKIVGDCTAILLKQEKERALKQSLREIKKREINL